MERFLRLSEVMECVGLSKTAIYRGMTAGTFPLQIKVSAPFGVSVRWVKSEIDEWMDARIAASRE